jgi:DNA-binding IclR family transcriptional regulator
VVAENGINLQSIKVARAVATGPSTVRKSLDALIAKSVLREEERDGRVRLRFEDPFFAQWTRLFTAGSRAKPRRP